MEVEEKVRWEIGEESKLLGVGEVLISRLSGGLAVHEKDHKKKIIRSVSLKS